MSASEIRAAVAAARHKLPLLAADYAETAIAAGRTVEAVKGDLVDLMLKGDPANTRSAARASMVKTIAAQYGADVAARAAASAAPVRDGMDPKAAVIGRRGAPAAAEGGRAVARRVTLDMIERKYGKAERDKAEARYPIRAG